MKQQATGADAFAPFQQALSQGWTQALESFRQSTAQAGSAFDIGGTPLWQLPKLPELPQMPRFSIDPEKLQSIQQQYLAEATELWRQGFDARPEGDRRFAGDAWNKNPLSAFSAAVYLLNGRTMLSMAEAIDADQKTKARLRFAVEQWMAASAPSNSLAFNAEAQKKAIDTQGESIAKGIQNLLNDVKQGHLSMTDESAFEVGRNVATTEGAVVFENEFFQLLEYKPLTPKVYERPFLLVPPCINKFYILDLQPENSLIRYANEQGHRVFVVSWRNPDESMGKATWDDYIENAAIKAIHTVQEISASKQINALGFCVGGTILSTALAVLAARGEKPAASVTLLTTFLDFSDTGILDIFVDYLKGETPPPFDLLYWNSDATNLPGPFYAWYLRNTYHENKLAKPNALTVCGEKIDLGRIDIPAYIYGSREDHIVPIGGAYASTQLLPGKKRFVMGASGHIAGVINPPAKKKRSHWIREDGKFPRTQAEWLAGAQEHPGSWWTDWAQWLKGHAGKQIPAPKAYGNGKAYKAIEPAPGRYVKAKA